MTPSQLRARCLEELGVTAAGETADGDDDTAISEKYTSWHAFMTQTRRIWWNSDDDIPDEVSDAVTLSLAHWSANRFGVNNDKRAWLERAHNNALRQISAVANKQGALRTATSPVYY